MFDLAPLALSSNRLRTEPSGWMAYSALCHMSHGCKDVENAGHAVIKMCANSFTFDQGSVTTLNAINFKQNALMLMAGHIYIYIYNPV